MPIYEYECTTCNYRFERMQSFNDDPLKECPQCGNGVRRVIQPVGIVFKGSGFYITDNRQISSSANGRPKPRELAEPKSDKPESTEPQKTEPKAEPKKETASTTADS